MTALIRALLAGLATGCRSTSAVAASALTPTSRHSNAADRTLHRYGPRWVPLVPVLGEAVADKLPRTPARTDVPGLLVRLGLGAFAAWLLAARHDEPRVLALAVGAAGAAASSFGGVRARAAVAAKAGSDLPGAVGEDVLALGLGFAATRLP